MPAVRRWCSRFLLECLDEFLSVVLVFLECCIEFAAEQVHVREDDSVLYVVFLESVEFVALFEHCKARNPDPCHQGVRSECA